MLRDTRGHRFAALFSALACFVLAGEVAGQTPSPTPNASSTPADFPALVKKGDQARIAGKWSDALEAYGKALELRDDPLVAGRLGLVLLALHEYEPAATQLMRAIERGAGVNDAERSRFFQAFVRAQKQTCRLDVTIVQTQLKLEFDGEARFSGRREFWAFVQAGKHKLHASLEGFEDQTIEIDAPKGGQLSIKIELRPVKLTEELAKQPDPEPTPKAADPPPHEDKPAAVVVENNPAAPTNLSRKNGSFVSGVGLGFVFGATPTPAMGPHAFVAWRSRSWWEVGVDARVAWTFVKDKRAPTTQFATWSVGVTPCGRLNDRWFGCGLVQLDGATRTEDAKARVLPGLGVRGGVEFETVERLGVQLVGDVVVHPGRFAFDFRERNIWSSSIVTGTLAVRVVIRQ